MQKINKFKIFTLLLLTLVITVFFSCGSGLKQKTPPVAKNGVLDVTGWDFNRDGSLKLEGEWDFYWKKLIDPKEFKKNPEKFLPKKNTIPVPGNWNTFTPPGGKEVGGIGYATYVLKIVGLSADSKKDLGLQLFEAGTEYAVYFLPVSTRHFFPAATSLEPNQDLEPVMQNGIVATDKSNSLPHSFPLIKKIPQWKKTSYILVQISNHRHRSGGFWEPLWFGYKNSLVKKRENSRARSFFILGIILIMALYHLGLFSQRREDKASLLFSMFCFNIVARVSCTDKLIHELFSTPGEITFELLYKLEYMTFYLATPIFYTFLCLVFTKEFPRIVHRFMWVIAGLFILELLIFQIIFYSVYNFIYQLITLTICSYAVYCIVKSVFHKREGALITFVGFMILFVTTIQDFLHSQNIINTSLLNQYGLVAFIFAQSYMLSKLFARAYITSEKLGKQLAVVHNIGASISRMNKIKALLEESIQSICKLLGAKEGSIFLYNDKENSLMSEVTYGINDDKIPSVFQIGEGIAGLSFQDRKTILIDDINKDERFIKPDTTSSKSRRSAMMTIPLTYQDTIYGVININDKQTDSLIFDQNDQYVAEMVSTNIAIQIKNIELLVATAEQARMDQELKTAQAVQEALFPEEDLSQERLTTAGFFQSASETGGDWYGYVMDGGRYQYILIGDVTGHGSPAALVTAAVDGACSTIQRMLDETGLLTLSPASMMVFLNSAVFKAGKQKYVMTFFASRFDIQTRELVFSNAGHNFPYYYSAEKNKLRGLALRGNRLGYNKDVTFKEKTIQLSIDDMILFFTDGLIECTNEKGEEYGKKRLKNNLIANAHKDVYEIRDKIVKDAYEFFGDEPRDDDVTLVVAKIS